MKLSASDEVEILLHEYDTLREQVMNFDRMAVTIITVTVTVTLAFIGLWIEYKDLNIFFLSPIFILLMFQFDTNRNFSMMYSGLNISILEQRINRLAQKELLLWDTKLTLHKIAKYSKAIQKKKVPISYQIGFPFIYGIIMGAFLIWGIYIGWYTIDQYLESLNYNSIYSYLYPAFIIIWFLIIVYIRLNIHPKKLELLTNEINHIRDESFNEVKGH